MNLFVLDNYDSFTFNLVQYFGELGAEPDVVRNDAITISDVERNAPDAVVISPGPGSPSDAGVSVELVGWCIRTNTPLLGVCLGHQAVGAALGGRVTEAPRIMHGKTSLIHHDGTGVFREVENPFEAMRYHSLVLDPQLVPNELIVTALSDDGLVMGIRHSSAPVEGVQFHPESILTGVGKRLLANFLDDAAAIRRR